MRKMDDLVIFAKKTKRLTLPKNNKNGPRNDALEKVDSLYNMAIFGIYVRFPGGTSPKFYIANPLNNG